MRRDKRNTRGRVLGLSTKLFLALLVAAGSVVTASAQTSRIMLDEGTGGKECKLFGNNPGTENAGPGNEMLSGDVIEVDGQTYMFIVGMNSDVENPGDGEGPWQCHGYTVRLSGPDAPVLVNDKQLTNNTKGNQPCNKPHTYCVQDAGVCLFFEGNDEDDGSNVYTYGHVMDPVSLDEIDGPVLLSEADDDNDNEGASSGRVVRKINDGWLGILGYNDNGDTAAVVPWLLTNNLELVRGSNGNDGDLDLCNATIPRIYCDEGDNPNEVDCAMRCGNRSDQRNNNGDGTYVYTIAVNGLNDIEEVSRKEVCKRQNGKICSDGEIARLSNGLVAVMAGTSGGPVEDENGNKDRNNKGPSVSGLYTLDPANNMDVMFNIQSIGVAQTHPGFAGEGLASDGVSLAVAVATSGRSDSNQGMLNIIKVNDDGTMEGDGTLDAGGIVSGGRTSNLCGGNPNQEGRDITHAMWIENPNFGVSGSQCPTSKGLWLWPHAGADATPGNYKNAAYLSVMCGDGSDVEIAPPEGDQVGTVVSDDAPGELAADDASSGGAGLCSAGSMASGSALVWILASIFGLVLARRRREEV